MLSRYVYSGPDKHYEMEKVLDSALGNNNIHIFCWFMGPLAFWLNEEFACCHYVENRSIRHILVFIDSAALLVFTSKIVWVEQTDTNC